MYFGSLPLKTRETGRCLERSKHVLKVVLFVLQRALILICPANLYPCFSPMLDGSSPSATTRLETTMARKHQNEIMTFMEMVAHL